MDIISAYREVGSYRGAAAISGTTHRTVKRVIARHEAGGAAPPRLPRGRNYDAVVELVAERVERSKGRITAKRLLPVAQAAGYEGSARNFRRLVAKRKALWRNDNHRGRRPAVWSPGQHLVIDWGVLDGLHVFCAVLAWCRVRFVRFALDKRAETTLGLLARQSPSPRLPQQNQDDHHRLPHRSQTPTTHRHQPHAHLHVLTLSNPLKTAKSRRGLGRGHPRGPQARSPRPVGSRRPRHRRLPRRPRRRPVARRERLRPDRPDGQDVLH